MVIQALFFPRKDLEAKICDYKHGKKFAVQFNTDTGVKGYTDFQLYQSFKYGIKYTLFSNRYNNGGTNSITNIDYFNNCNTGLVELQNYFATDRWINPTTGIDELIPDHSGIVWTALGANAFGMVIGESKTRYYPNHGQELYDISGGAYGYDAINGVYGQSNLSEFFGIKLKNDEWVNELELPKNSSFSYRNGRNTTPSIYKLIYLGGRNSERSSDFVYYGKSKIDGQPLGNDLPLSRVSQVNQKETTRWVDASHNPVTANQLIRNGIELAFNTRGLYGDFSHFHNTSIVNLENLFKTAGDYLDSMNYRKDCWIAGYGELTEYFWFRELTKRAVATIFDSKIYITLEWENLKTIENGISDSVFMNMLNTPLSIELDLTGTILEGKQIKSTGGKILALGEDKYIIDFPFSKAVEGIKSVVIYEGDGDYYPVVDTSYTITQSGSNVTITTSNKTKSVLFSTDTDIYSIVSQQFSNEYSNTHIFTIDASKTNYIGIVDELGRTNNILIQE